MCWENRVLMCRRIKLEAYLSQKQFQTGQRSEMLKLPEENTGKTEDKD